MPKNQKKTGRQNYDWAKIQHDYVTDPNMTLRKIAEKYGINYKTVALRSKADNWFATRKKHQSNVLKKSISKTATKQANDLAKEMELLAKMQEHVTRAVDDKAQFNRHIKVDPVTGDVSEQILDKVDTRAVKDIMQTLKLIEDMSRSLYNIQKAEAIQRQQMEAERLAIERERLELEKERTAMKNGMLSADEYKYGVVLIPEVKDE